MISSRLQRDYILSRGKYLSCIFSCRGKFSPARQIFLLRGKMSFLQEKNFSFKGNISPVGENFSPAEGNFSPEGNYISCMTTSLQAPRCASWKAHKLTNWQAHKLTRWQNDKMSIWQDDMKNWQKLEQVCAKWRWGWRKGCRPGAGADLNQIKAGQGTSSPLSLPHNIFSLFLSLTGLPKAFFLAPLVPPHSLPVSDMLLMLMQEMVSPGGTFRSPGCKKRAGPGGHQTTFPCLGCCKKYHSWDAPLLQQTFSPRKWIRIQNLFLNKKLSLLFLGCNCLSQNPICSFATFLWQDQIVSTK